MRWLGLAMSILGVLLFLGAVSFDKTLEAQSTLCQVVEGEKLIGAPIRLLLPEGATFVKGTGPKGSRFIERAQGPFRSYDSLAQFAGLAKISALIITALGVVGYQFEKWRHRTGSILTGRSPD